MENKYFKHISKGGYNPCILIKGDSVLPNCVGYAWGKFAENNKLGKDCKLPTCNAEDWYRQKMPYKKGKIPKVGAVICFAKGREGYSADGCGHVGIVEKILSDGSIVVGQSGYNNKKEYYQTVLSKGYAFYGYTFQGFIYPPTKETTYKGSWWTPTVRFGQVGENVRKIQQYLVWCGYTLVKDGSFGPKTHKAVIEMQRECKVRTDGDVGPITTKAFKKVKR